MRRGAQRSNGDIADMSFFMMPSYKKLLHRKWQQASPLLSGSFTEHYTLALAVRLPFY